MSNRPEGASAPEEERAELSTAEINDLPDSDFAYIEPGGKLDKEGKTVPRSLRHFPINDAPRVRDALARAPQSPFGEKAMPKILAAAKKFGIEVAEQKSAAPSGERRRKLRHRAVPLLPEIRHWRADGLEVRSEAATDQILITGSPIVYNVPYAVRDLFGEFEETMLPGVAAKPLASGADVRFLFDHDGLPLARSTAGTLRLTDSPTALRMTASLDARQQIANDLAIAIERGDVSQMSCGFIVARDAWDEREEHREISELAELLDVSAVTYPASPSTELQIAHRMAMQVPVESRARIRRIYADLRAGKVLSQDNQEKLVQAAQALHAILDSAGYDPSQLLSEANPNDEPGAEAGRGTNEDGTTGGDFAGDSAPGYADMTGSRSDEGEPISSAPRLTSSALRLMVEARKRRRIVA